MLNPDLAAPPAARYAVADAMLNRRRVSLDSQVRIEPDWTVLTAAERMVIVMRRLVSDTDSVVTLDDFKREPETHDLSATTVTAHIGEAKTLFEAEQRAAWAIRRREMRLDTARKIVLGLAPDAGMVHAALRNAGFEPTEEADLWPEIVATSADQWAFNLAGGSAL